jgi:hypothetical protein
MNFQQIDAKNFIIQYIRNNKIKNVIMEEVNYQVELEFKNFMITGQRYNPYENIHVDLERQLSIYCNDKIIFQVKKKNNDYFLHITVNNITFTNELFFEKLNLKLL